MRYTIFDGDKNIVNIIEWDGDETQWSPPEGHTVQLSNDDDTIPVDPSSSSVDELDALKQLLVTKGIITKAESDVIDSPVSPVSAVPSAPVIPAVTPKGKTS